VDSLQQTNEMSSPQGMSPSNPHMLFRPNTSSFSLSMKNEIEMRRGKEEMEKEREKEDGVNNVAISQTIQNHKNAIYDLAATVEGLEVRWNDVRGYYSYVTFHLSLSPTLPPFYLSTFLPFYLSTFLPFVCHTRFLRIRRSLALSLALFPLSLSSLSRSLHSHALLPLSLSVLAALVLRLL
jgi:hypothetical protein